MKNLMKINGIHNGVVIDHISNKSTMNIFSILNTDNQDLMISAAYNLPSARNNKKGIIKIENKTLNQEEIDKISILSPGATINYIVDGSVKEKIICKMPSKIKNILKCGNSKCITNNERSIYTVFDLSEKENKPSAKCFFCEKTSIIEEMNFKNEDL
ncbi:MAG: aspartate carbamoyltransferase regulatory subunit [Mycoplasma sp.]